MTITMQGGTNMLPTLLGQGAPRMPTGGKIRPGIKALTKKAAQVPEASAIYKQGIAQGHSFEQIERELAKALPDLKSPLVPRNVPWFTVREQDFPNPEVARQIMDTYGEDRGEGRHLYKFPVVFLSDHWQSVMPHELAAWGANEKRFWSQYSPDGQTRQCMCYAPVPIDQTSHRVIRLFGGRKTVMREDNGGVCAPESCPEYQTRQCNLTGRFLFFIPGIRTLNALELPTTSFYAMSKAIERFQAVAYMRGGRISGFIGQARTPFFLTKVLRDVPHIDDTGRVARVQQWIIELEAPVDITALVRGDEDQESVITQANFASRVLEGGASGGEGVVPPPTPAPEARHAAVVDEPAMHPGHPTLEQLLARVQAFGIDPEQFSRYADGSWGGGWKVNPNGRRRVWEEMGRYQNDPQGYADKIDAALQARARRNG
jgi:hypothetical protein